MCKRMTAFILGALLATTGPLHAQTFGLQASWGDDVDFGLGGRAAFDLVPASSLELIGSFDYFFPDEPAGMDIDYWELNGNLAYAFNVAGAPGFAPYVGAGLNVAHGSASFEADPDLSSSDTEAGLNLLGGARFGRSSVKPYAELRFELGGGEQVVLTGGLLFF